MRAILTQSLVLCVVLAAAAMPLRAGDAAVSALPERPTVRATAIESGDAPQVDGDISDAIWSRAPRIDRFYQVEPVPMSAPSEPTEAWILYDRNELYVALYVHESNPGRVNVTTMERDGDMQADDVVRVMLDPRRTRREGYVFTLNMAGARGDALLTGASQNNFISKWNMLWRGKARRVADGWTAEIAVPFRGLSYDPASTEWGLDIVRQIRATSETIRWSATPPGTRMVDLTYAGTLDGLAGMTQGRGLDVVTYATGRATRNWAGGSTRLSGDPSATAYYKFTPALTGLLTVNTDFSEKPLDSRQVNTTRFSLFEPETREFFLEDTDAFEFANFGTGSAANGRPFFSRNIGLVKGTEVDLDAGAKLSGNIGALRVGALSVRTGPSSTGPAQTLSVARLTAQVLGESRVGVIATDGDPTGLSRNRVAGADFQYRNSSFRPGKQLNVTAYVQRSFSSARGDDNAFGSEISYPNEPWGATARFAQIGRDFSPALGFMNRPEIRSWYEEVKFVRRPRASWLRKLTLTPSDLTVTDLHNGLQSGDSALSLEMENVRDDKLTIGVNRFREVLTAPFTLPGNVVVPAGRYQYLRPRLALESAQSRRVVVHWTFTCCDYLGGRSAENDLQIAIHTGVRVGLAFRHRLQTIDLPGGRSTIHIESLDVTRNFSPEMKLVTELQYDNVSHQFGASLRYRWEIRPTTELLVTLGESALLYGRIPGGSYHSQATAVSVRLGHRFQN